MQQEPNSISLSPKSRTVKQIQVANLNSRQPRFHSPRSILKRSTQNGRANPFHRSLSGQQFQQEAYLSPKATPLKSLKTISFDTDKIEVFKYDKQEVKNQEPPPIQQNPKKNQRFPVQKYRQLFQKNQPDACCLIM